MKEEAEVVVRVAFEKLAGIVATLAPTELLVVDSTPLEDWRDSKQGQASTLEDHSRLKFVLGDAGYDSKSSRKACRKIEAEPCIARNPRNSGKHYKLPQLLKRKYYLVEQFNSLLKEMLQNCWRGFKGLMKKAMDVYSGLLAISAVALRVLGDMRSLRKISMHSTNSGNLHKSSLKPQRLFNLHTPKSIIRQKLGNQEIHVVLFSSVEP